MHPTKAEINLSAIEFNLSQVRSRVGERLVMAAVKANAYGHGAVPVCRMIEQTKAADWLAIATVDEAVELRQAGIQLPILKLSHAHPVEIAPAIEHDVDLCVVDRASIIQVARTAAECGKQAYVQLKIDTGMRRIGAEPDQAQELVQLIDESEHLHLRGIFTHLPVADTPSQNEFTTAQLGRFHRLVADLEATRGKIELVHAANSGAILGHDLGSDTLVRPGIMIYGYYPDGTTPRTVELRPALRLVSEVSFVKRISAGESVGYGRTFTAEAATWVATVPIGYGDGYSRLLSNRGRMLVRGRSYPVIGRVCMDQTMINLGSETQIEPGDQVTIIGRDGNAEVSVDEIATLMRTITYEVTCLLTPRVKRTYITD